MKKSIWNPPTWMILAAALIIPGAALWAGEVETPSVYPTAIFPFVERDGSLKGYGEKVSDLLFAQLAVSPHVVLVERAEIKKLLDELGLGLSGIIRPDQAGKIGRQRYSVSPGDLPDNPGIRSWAWSFGTAGVSFEMSWHVTVANAVWMAL